MKKHNWVAQDKDGEIYTYERKPGPLVVAWQGYDNGCALSAKGKPNYDWRKSLIDLSKNDYIIKDGILMATRKHAALIHAWADGAEIEYFNKDSLEWMKVLGNNPSWFDDTEYRIKPKTRTVTFKNYHIDGVMGVWVQGYQGLPGNAKLIDRDWQEVEIEL